MEKLSVGRTGLRILYSDQFLDFAGDLVRVWSLSSVTVEWNGWSIRALLLARHRVLLRVRAASSCCVCVEISSVFYNNEVARSERRIGWMCWMNITDIPSLVAPRQTYMLVNISGNFECDRCVPRGKRANGVSMER